VEALIMVSNSQVVGVEESETKPGLKYEIGKTQQGVIYCTCMAWKFSRSFPKTCKHIKKWEEKQANHQHVMFS
jgi:hypothetical protein